MTDFLPLKNNVYIELFCLLFAFINLYATFLFYTAIFSCGFICVCVHLKNIQNDIIFYVSVCDTCCSILHQQEGKRESNTLFSISLELEGFEAWSSKSRVALCLRRPTILTPLEKLVNLDDLLIHMLLFYLLCSRVCPQEDSDWRFWWHSWTGDAADLQIWSQISTVVD